jgi:8-oxo-dGTP diphosphatase
METQANVVAVRGQVPGGGHLESDRPAVWVSTVVFSFDGAKLRVLAIKMRDEVDTYSIPGLQFDFSDDLLSTARQAIRSRLPLDLAQLFQVGAFESGRPDTQRDASRRLEICYFTTASPSDLEFVATGALPQYRFLEVHDQSDLLDSHGRELAQAALTELRRRARFETVAFSFLSHEFSLSELQRVFEAILNRPLDVRNFRKKIEALDILQESPHRPRGMAYRPPRMFSFEAERFRHRETLDGEVRFY